MAVTRHQISSKDFIFQSNSLYFINIKVEYSSSSQIYPIVITINNHDVWMELNDNRNTANRRNQIKLYYFAENNIINNTQQIAIFEILDISTQTSAVNSTDIMNPVIIENYIPNSDDSHDTKCRINSYSLLFAPQTISTPTFNIKNAINLYRANTLIRDDSKYGVSSCWTLDFKLNFPLLNDPKNTNNTIIYITDNVSSTSLIHNSPKLGPLIYHNTLHQFGIDIDSEITLIPSSTQLNHIGSGMKHIIFKFNNLDKKLSFYIGNQLFGELILQNLGSSYFFYLYNINANFLSHSNKISELRFFSWTIEDIHILSECAVNCIDLNSKQHCISKSCVWFEKSQQCLNAPIHCKQSLLIKEECNGEIFDNNDEYELSHLLQSNCYYNENSKSCEIGKNYKLEMKQITNIEAISEHTNINNLYHCKTKCETVSKCIHWEYNKTNKICKLFGNGQYIGNVNNDYIHGYPVSITGSLISHIISSEIENECKSRSLSHVIIQINSALLYGILNGNHSDTFIGGLYPQIKFKFGKMSVISYYGEGGRNIHDDKFKNDDNSISLYWRNEIVDLGWHCNFNTPIIVSIIARDEFSLYKNGAIQSDIKLFEGKLNIQQIATNKLNSWYPAIINDETNNKKNVINTKIAMFKSCKIDCSSDIEMTIYAKHFITTHPWSYINFEIMYFGQFISTEQHISGSSWNEKIMFKNVCKLRNDIKLNPTIWIYENYEPIGRELWGFVDDINIDDILNAHITDNSHGNIYVLHVYIKNPTFNGGEYKLQTNMDKDEYIPYLKVKIKLSEISKNCLIPELNSSDSVYGYASMANFGIATLITLICTVFILCISTIYFDYKRHSHYKLSKRIINKDSSSKTIDTQQTKNNKTHSFASSSDDTDDIDS